MAGSAQLTLIGTDSNEYRGRAGMGANPQLHQVFARSFVLAALLISVAAIIAGCASTIADHAPKVMGGLPDSTPARPTAPAAYPAVHEMPPPRSSNVLTSQEQKKLEDELVDARNRAAAAAASGKPAGGTGNP
ncbi:MAG TPA: hypothetical protein VGH39_08935 [Xanthobacteraceae bacterium]|jgi:hypothetical protein